MHKNKPDIINVEEKVSGFIETRLFLHFNQYTCPRAHLSLSPSPSSQPQFQVQLQSIVGYLFNKIGRVLVFLLFLPTKKGCEPAETEPHRALRQQNFPL